MLKFMRRNAKNWMIKIILVGIIVVFVLYFGYGSSSDKQKPIAEVGPYKISPVEYHEAYNKELEFYKMVYRDQFNDNMIKEIKDKTIDDLISKYLLLIEADKMGLKISGAEFDAFLNSIEAFKKNGVFDKETYVSTLRRNNLDPEKFEENQKKMMLLQKTASIIEDTSTFSGDQEMWKAYVEERGKVNLSFAVFDPALFKGKVTLSDKEVLDAYEREKNSFKGENTYQFKDLVIDKSSPLKDQDVYMELLKNKDLDAYGREKGIPVAAISDIGESSLLKQFPGLKIEDLKTFKKGDITLPLRTTEGKSHILQLVNKTEGQFMDKDIAMGKMKEKLLLEKAKPFAKNAAETAISNKSIAPRSETGLILRSTRDIPGLGAIASEHSGIFALSPSSTIYSKPLDISGKYYVFSFKSEEAPDKGEWEKNKEGYRRQFTAKNKNEFLKFFLAEKRKEVTVKYNEKDL